MSIRLDDPINKIPLVGAVKANLLSKLGIERVRDLLFHIPFRYKDTSQIYSISNLIEEREGTILVKLLSIKNVYTRSRKVLTQAVVEDGTGTIDIVWFNQRYLSKSLKVGERYLFEGKLNPKQSKPQMISPTFEQYYEGLISQKHVGRITPFYPETANVSSKWLRTRIDSVLDDLTDQIPDPIPTKIITENNLISLHEAIYNIHNPKSVEDIEIARKRLEFDEMLTLSLQIESQVVEGKNKKANRIDIDFDNIYEFIKSLTYTLTDDQIVSIKDIITDLSSTVPMRRLLNGDVGSGKTVVATAVMFGILKAGYSSILMAPTSILARQHHKSISDLLKPFKIEVQLRTSSEKITPSKAPQIIIGTHALLYENELPDNIGLVVVDEQHRFGVNQRKDLLKNDINNLLPHYLSMSATPIPRTLTNILFGDMSVSLINQMPLNRLPVKTNLVPLNKRSDCYTWIKERIVSTKSKEQAFIIFPLVEESEVVEAKSAKKEFDNLKKTYFKDINIALLHGQMKEKEKDTILRDFKDGKYSVLIATPVVEVGIDIPNATMMIIENAERFGLAQLHQFRGRVGRNNMQSHCFLMTGDRIEQDSEAIDRLRYFSTHNSGFDVAEYDLQRRGPGEVFGTKQAGIPNFKIASISNIKLLLDCRKVAKEMIANGMNIDNLKNGLFK